MASPKDKPKGYFEYILAADCETSGMCYNCDDPSYNPKTKEYYQAVSWGLAVVHAPTLEVIDRLYVEIQWDGKSVWNEQAQAVHGLSRQYLNENGVPMSEAVGQIGNLILPYWGTTSIRLLGHNIMTFDLPFLRRTMRSEGIELSFGNRHIDTSSIGYALFGTYNSDDLFDIIGLPERDPKKHNALDDALSCVHVLKAAKAVRKRLFGEI